VLERVSLAGFWKKRREGGLTPKRRVSQTAMGPTGPSGKDPEEGRGKDACQGSNNRKKMVLNKERGEIADAKQMEEGWEERGVLRLGGGQHAKDGQRGVGERNWLKPRTAKKTRNKGGRKPP